MNFLRIIPITCVLGIIPLIGRETQFPVDYEQCVVARTPEQHYVLREGDIMSISSGTIAAVSQERITYRSTFLGGPKGTETTNSYIAPQVRLDYGTPILYDGADWPFFYGHLGEESAHIMEATILADLSMVKTDPKEDELRVTITCHKERK